MIGTRNVSLFEQGQLALQACMLRWMTGCRQWRTTYAPAVTCTAAQQNAWEANSEAIL